MPNLLAPNRYRAVFLSDLHLGARGARPGAVLDFLAETEAETIFLVGDVFDLWHGGRVHWTAECRAVVAELTHRARAGVRVVYLAGNHDAPLRKPGAVRLPEGWERADRLVHTAADGQRYLVIHGDQADRRLFRFHIMTRIGSRAEAALRALDAWLGNGSPAHRGPEERSRIDRLIVRFNSLFVMAGRFERKLTEMARAVGAQGVICGHSHKPLLREVEGTVFANCGDWVDSLTALTEDHSGTLRLVGWGHAPVTQSQGGGGALAQGA